MKEPNPNLDDLLDLDAEHLQRVADERNRQKRETRKELPKRIALWCLKRALEEALREGSYSVRVGTGEKGLKELLAEEIHHEERLELCRLACLELERRRFTCSIPATPPVLKASGEITWIVGWLRIPETAPKVEIPDAPESGGDWRWRV